MRGVGAGGTKASYERSKFVRRDGKNNAFIF